MVALGPRPRDDVVRLRPKARERPLPLHLRTLDSGRARRHALAVSTENVWHDETGGVLSRVFALTGAEIALVRALAAGETVREVARASGRTEGTVRSQLHSILGKTGACSQGELVRLATMLLQAVAVAPARPRPARSPARCVRDRQRGHVRLADGRKLAVMQLGDPSGRPVLWLQSVLRGCYPTTKSGEQELRRRNIRLLVPIRAGFGASHPAPPERDVHEVAVADHLEILRQAEIASCPVVAPDFGLGLTLMLARAAPQRVDRIVGIGCAFPIVRIEQFRRLHATGRIWVACARYAPHILPFLIRASHANMIRNGLAEQVRAFLSLHASRCTRIL